MNDNPSPFVLTNPEANIKMMGEIKQHLGGYIRDAIQGCAFPESFLAALTANESGGDPTVTRFEPAVFAQLAMVVTARKAGFGSISAIDIVRALPTTLSPALVQLINFATSWGPTQIMGYQALARKYDLAELPNVQTHYRHAVEILQSFEDEWSLPPFTTEKGAVSGVPIPEYYFVCWNTGRPDGPTADPNYAAKGIARMQIYEALP